MYVCELCVSVAIRLYYIYDPSTDSQVGCAGQSLRYTLLSKAYSLAKLSQGNFNSKDNWGQTRSSINVKEPS
jgi:hypothetical protein